jgi:hypothetical protein
MHGDYRIKLRKICQDSRSPYRDCNPRPPEWQSEMPKITPQCSVFTLLFVVSSLLYFRLFYFVLRWGTSPFEFCDNSNKLLHQMWIGLIWWASVRKLVHMTNNFVANKPTLILIISGKFVAKKLSSVFRAEAKSWWPKISRRSRGGTRCDTMDGSTGEGLISTGYRKSRRTTW